MTFWGPDFDDLQETDPEIADVVLDELTRLRGGPAADRERELHQPGRARGARLHAVRTSTPRATPASATTAAARSSTVAEAHRHRAGQGAVRRRPRQPAAALRRQRQPRGVRRPPQPGDTVLAMSLPHGGHLTHGTKVNFTGKWFNAVHYGVDKDTEDIDYDEVRDLALEHRPKMIICGATAYPAADRLRRVPRDRRRGRRVADGRRRALHRPGRRARRSRARCPTPTSSRSRRTRCCAARAAA